MDKDAFLNVLEACLLSFDQNEFNYSIYGSIPYDLAKFGFNLSVYLKNKEVQGSK